MKLQLVKPQLLKMVVGYDLFEYVQDNQICYHKIQNTLGTCTIFFSAVVVVAAVAVAVVGVVVVAVVVVVVVAAAVDAAMNIQSKQLLRTIINKTYFIL